MQEQGGPAGREQARLGLVPLLTRPLVLGPLPSLPESHQGSEVGPEHGPAERSGRVDADEAADEGVPAAFQQGYDVRAHVVRVLLSEILRETHGRPD